MYDLETCLSHSAHLMLLHCTYCIYLAEILSCVKQSSDLDPLVCPFGVTSWPFLVLIFYSVVVKHSVLLLWEVQFCLGFPLTNITTSHKALMIHITPWLLWSTCKLMSKIQCSWTLPYDVNRLFCSWFCSDVSISLNVIKLLLIYITVCKIRINPGIF